MSLQKDLVPALKYSIATTGLVLSVVHFIPGLGFYKIWSYLATIPIAFAADILRRFGLKISWRLELSYLCFLLLAMVLGIDFDWYKTTPFFDKMVHTLSGLLCVAVAQEILSSAPLSPKAKLQSIKASPLKNKTSKTSAVPPLLFNFLFTMGFVALAALLWECFEYSYDCFCGGSMQQLIAPGIHDTMWDLISGLLGGLLGWLILYYRSQLKSFINKIIKL